MGIKAQLTYVALYKELVHLERQIWPSALFHPSWPVLQGIHECGKTGLIQSEKLSIEELTVFKFAAVHWRPFRKGAFYSWGYQGGGNILECIVFGHVARERAAAEKPWA